MTKSFLTLHGLRRRFAMVRRGMVLVPIRAFSTRRKAYRQYH
jgi:hypothetical protein